MSAVLKPRPMDEAVAWLEFALHLACENRRNMARVKPGSGDFYFYGAHRDLAVECARTHLGTLRAAGYRFDVTLADKIVAEGVDLSPPLAYHPTEVRL